VSHAELDGERDADESTPNGPDREPTCWQLDLAISDGALALEAAEVRRAHRAGSR